MARLEQGWTRQDKKTSVRVDADVYQALTLEADEVQVALVGHRRDVYEKLKRRF